MSTALKNREKYSLDPLPNQDLQRELSEKWESIDSAIKEREKRLEMAESFHRETEEILRELERLSHPTANLPETRVAVEGAVEELGHHGNDLRKKMEDAIGEFILCLVRVCECMHALTLACLHWQLLGSPFC